MSAFDPNTFLSQELKGANETKYTPIPNGEYTAFVDEVGFAEYEGKPILEVTVAIPDEKLKSLLGMDKPSIRDRIFLDTNEDGTIAFGTNKNVKLGRLREACKLNDPNKKFTFNALRGCGPLKIMVEQQPGKNPGEVFPRIARYAAGK